jgi:hypothetical protein
MMKVIKTSDEFRAWCAEIGHPLPWDVVGDQVIDANRTQVVYVQLPTDCPKGEVSAIGLAIILAVNLCGSFRADEVETQGTA